MYIDDREKNLEGLLNYIKKLTGIGHSFHVVVDPNNPTHEKDFFIDGDGSDRIKNVDIEDGWNW